MAEGLQIFISYAHRDGTGLAKRLQADLEAAGFNAWLDRHRLLGGDAWSREIETAIDRSDAIVALLSEGSYESDICRAEQERALEKGKLVVPVKFQLDCDVPLPLQTAQHVDFSDESQYAACFQQLRDSICGRRGATRAEGRRQYNNSPPLPDNFVDRPGILTSLRNALFQDAPNRNIAVTALAGMGGIGKTVLAEAICHHEVVEHAYPDGIFWFTIGRESSLRFDQRVEAVPGLKRLLGTYSGEDACLSQYRNALRDRAALVVLDDVWRTADIEPFRTESPRSRLLITTRDAGIAPNFGAREFTARFPEEGEAREVLARWAGLTADELPPQATEIIDECKNLPLALAMIGAQLNGRPLSHWSLVLGYLRNADLDKIRARFPEPHTTLLRAIQISYDALAESDQVVAQRYLDLAVLLEDMDATPPIQRTLWNVDEAEAIETAERLVSLSMAQRGRTGGSIALHDLQLDYTRARFPDRADLGLIQGAVRLSSSVIEQDPWQFGPQLIGRLLCYESRPAIRRFTNVLLRANGPARLQPLWPALHPPGTPLERVLAGHTADVNGVAVCLSGQCVISASWDQTLKVWDPESGRELFTLSGHTDRVNCVAVFSDGRKAVSGSSDKTLRVWSLESKRELSKLQGHSAAIKGVAVSPDGRQAISCSFDRTLKVWDLETGHELRTLKGHGGSVNGVAMSTDGRHVFSASSDRTLKVWDLKTARELRTLEGHSGAVNAVALSSDRRRAFSASSDHTLKVWDVETGRELHTLAGHNGLVNGVAVSPDGQRILSASWDNTLRLWDAESGRQVGTLEGHSSDVYTVVFRPDGRRAFSCSRDKTVNVWNVTGIPEPRTLTGHPYCVYGVAVSRDGRRAVSASWDKTLKVWDLGTGKEIRALEGHTDCVHCVAVSEDGSRAVSASWDQTLRVWDLDTGRELRKLEGHAARVEGVALSADGGRVVSASDDLTLKVWDTETGRELRTLTGHSAKVESVAVTRNGRKAVSASDDGTLKVWNLDTGHEVRTLEGHPTNVNGVAISSDGRVVVSASRHNTLKVWDLQTGRERCTLKGHTGRVHGVGVSPDGLRTVSASSDHSLIVWELATGKRVATFTCDSPARCCTFTDNGTILAGDRAGRVHLLTLEDGISLA